MRFSVNKQFLILGLLVSFLLVSLRPTTSFTDEIESEYEDVNDDPGIYEGDDCRDCNCGHAYLNTGASLIECGRCASGCSGCEWRG